jgi:hypothetical protein
VTNRRVMIWWKRCAELLLVISVVAAVKAHELRLVVLQPRYVRQLPPAV